MHSSGLEIKLAWTENAFCPLGRKKTQKNILQWPIWQPDKQGPSVLNARIIIMVESTGETLLLEGEHRGQSYYFFNLDQNSSYFLLYWHKQPWKRAFIGIQWLCQHQQVVRHNRNTFVDQHNWCCSVYTVSEWSAMQVAAKFSGAMGRVSFKVCSWSAC